jgi:hypothetical protein
MPAPISIRPAPRRRITPKDRGPGLGSIAASSSCEQARAIEVDWMRNEGTRDLCCFRGRNEEALRGRPKDGALEREVHSGGLQRQNPRRIASAAMCRGELIVETRVVWPHPEAESFSVSMLSPFPQLSTTRPSASSIHQAIYVAQIDRVGRIARCGAGATRGMAARRARRPLHRVSARDVRM